MFDSRKPTIYGYSCGLNPEAFCRYPRVAAECLISRDEICVFDRELIRTADLFNLES